MNDVVTGARVDVTIPVDLPRERVWELVTDVLRYGDWSPECDHTEWLQGGGPKVGARFSGHNTISDEISFTTVCEVTEMRQYESFAWAVLDGAEDVRRPGSIWRYELVPGAAGGTLLRQTFEHGPGDSGARKAADRDPKAMAARLAQLCENMTTSITRMVAGEK